MFQVAASLLFFAACGCALIVIVAMLRNNAGAIASALVGQGAFPDELCPAGGPSHQSFALRRIPARPVEGAFSLAATRPRDVSRAAA